MSFYSVSSPTRPSTDINVTMRTHYPDSRSNTILFKLGLRIWSFFPLSAVWEINNIPLEFTIEINIWISSQPLPDQWKSFPHILSIQLFTYPMKPMKHIFYFSQNIFCTSINVIFNKSKIGNNLSYCPYSGFSNLNILR